MDNHISLRLYNSKLLRTLFLEKKKNRCACIHIHLFWGAHNSLRPFNEAQAKDSQSKRRSTFKLLIVPLAQTFRDLTLYKGQTLTDLHQVSPLTWLCSFGSQKNSCISHHIYSKTWWIREHRGRGQSVSFEVTLSKTLFLLTTSSIQYFSINRRDGKRWSLGLLLALIFYNSICWLSSKILQGRNCKFFMYIT